MCFRSLSKCVYPALCLLTCFFVSASYAVNVEQFVIKNAGIARTISGVADIIKTTKITANSEQFLDQPSVEFMIDLDVNGKNVRLIPSDFHIEAVDSAETSRERRVTIALTSKYDAVPQFAVLIDYFYEPKLKYMHKSVVVRPCRKFDDVTIKRVIIESMRFKPQFKPLRMDGSIAEDSSFAICDPKSRKGLYFFVDSPNGTVVVSGSYLTVFETTDMPLSECFTSARVTIGAAAGDCADVLASYRDLILDVRWPTLARSKSFAAFKKRFSKYFSQCRFVGLQPFSGPVDGAAYFADGHGFLLLLNSSEEPKKIFLPLNSPDLRLSGQVTITDWTSFESPVPVGVTMVGDNFAVDIEPKSYRVIGLNI